MESWRSTILAIIPGLAGLALLIIGAVKGDMLARMIGIGLLGVSGLAIGIVTRPQRAHDPAQPQPSSWDQTRCRLRRK